MALRLQRPLSPHLTVYQPQRGSVLSISMRITGVLLGLPFLALGFYPFVPAFPTMGGVSETDFGKACVSLIEKIPEPFFQSVSLGSGYIPLPPNNFEEELTTVFVLSFCVLSLWTLFVYHAVHPLTENYLQEYYLFSPTAWSPEFWKIHYTMCMLYFTFLLFFGFGVWSIYVLEVGDAYMDIFLCHNTDDLGPLFGGYYHGEPRGGFFSAS